MSFWMLPLEEVLAGYKNNDGAKEIINYSSFPIQINNFGAWMSNQIPLEALQSHKEKTMAIDLLTEQGYNEYYFLISDYKSKNEQSNVEDLLAASDNSSLRMIAILLPPSEGGENGNYNWDGWIKYLNSLKDNHPSLDGFIIDDFNWFGTEEVEEEDNNNEHQEANLKENVDFMIKSDLDKALQNKRKDLNFFPVLFEGIDTNNVKRNYFNYSDGIILASSQYYNVTDLQHNLGIFSKVFDNKPIRYVIYTARTSSFIEQGYSPPSDRLILATLSIANKIHGIDGIIVWRNTNNHVMRDYMSNTDNQQYLSFISMMENFQLKDEKESGTINGPSYHAFLQPPEDDDDNKNNGNNNEDNDYSQGKNSKKDNENISNKPSTPWLGISGFDLTSSAIAKDMRLPENYEGVVIQAVVPDSPAAKAGLNGTILDVDNNGYLIRKGDVITSMDGKKIDQITDITKHMEKKKPGETLTLTVNRNGAIFDTSTILQAFPK